MSTYNKIISDPFYRTVMASMVGRWEDFANSSGFERVFGAQTDAAREELKNIIHGMQDACGQRSEHIEAGISAAKGMKDFLMRKTPQGRTYYQVLKKAAKINKMPMENFFKDLHYMNETLDLGLNMQKLDPESVVPKVAVEAGSWEIYALEHLTRPPYSPKERVECLARAFAGVFLAGEKTRNPAAKEYPLSRVNADRMTKYIMQQPAFKRLTKDPRVVDELLEKGRVKPDLLFDDVVRCRQPFYKIEEPDKYREILGNLKKMEPLMDNANAYDAKWKALRESISSIDLNHADPEKYGERKLQEILDKTTAFMKGKKSLRQNQVHAKCFDQSLDILAELAKGSRYAEAEAQSLVDRINEVRSNKDNNYRNIGLRSYGATHIQKHTTSRDENLINNYINNRKYKDGVKPEIEREVRMVFQPYPKNDFSLLHAAPKEMKAEKVRHAANRYRKFLLSEKEISGLHVRVFPNDIRKGLAGILALSECQMYVRESKKTGESDVVLDKDFLDKKQWQYFNDAALTPLVQKYSKIEARRQLSNGSNDILDVNVNQLREEFDALKKAVKAGGPKAVI